MTAIVGAVDALVISATYSVSFQMTHEELALLNLRLNATQDRLVCIEHGAVPVTDEFMLCGSKFSNWDLVHRCILVEVVPDWCIFEFDFEE